MFAGKQANKREKKKSILFNPSIVWMWISKMSWQPSSIQRGLKIRFAHRTPATCLKRHRTFQKLITRMQSQQNRLFHRDGTIVSLQWHKCFTAMTQSLHCNENLITSAFAGASPCIIPGVKAFREEDICVATFPTPSPSAVPSRPILHVDIMSTHFQK